MTLRLNTLGLAGSVVLSAALGCGAEPADAPYASYAGGDAGSSAGFGSAGSDAAGAAGDYEGKGARPGSAGYDAGGFAGSAGVAGATAGESGASGSPALGGSGGSATGGIGGNGGFANGGSANGGSAAGGTSASGGSAAGGVAGSGGLAGTGGAAGAGGQITAKFTTVLSPTAQHQQIFGIGANFCRGDQTALVNSKLYDQVFSSSGLNLSMIRVDSALEIAEYPGYDTANVAVVKAFRARQPKGKVKLVTWSPPSSLKSNGQQIGGTLAKDAAGKYRYADFAAWWTRILKFYKAEAALPDYVSIQNEADFTPTARATGPNPSYLAGNYLVPVESSKQAAYPAALAAVRTAFAASGFGSTKILGPDTTAIARDKVKSYMDVVPAGQLYGISHHLYNDDAATTGIPLLTRLHTQFPKLPKIMSEMNPGDDLGSTMPDWMGLAVTMHNVFHYEEANAYLVWSLMWGTINPRTGKPAGTRTYYPLGHFSKFIRPNDWRVEATTTDPKVLASLYRHPVGAGLPDQLILILINTGAATSTQRIRTSAVWANTPARRSWRVHQTANSGTTQLRLTTTENVTGASLSGDRVLALPAYSLTTAVINSDTP